MPVAINILSNNTSANSRAFNRPILAAKKNLVEEGFNVHFYFSLDKNIFASEILFVNSNFFRTFWSDRKDMIFRTLESAAGKRQKIIWFDTSDSTWCTQFEALPYVDGFAKSHLLKDRSLYLKNFRTGRIFTDFFDGLYACGEQREDYPPAAEEQTQKIALSWSPYFEQYDENRYGLGRKLSNLAWPLANKFPPPRLKVDFYPVSASRPRDISARFGLAHSRPSVLSHRKAVAKILEKRACDCAKISLKKYFAEMKQSKISASPFGVGEFCYRDYETIVCGAALLKPDMSHMETWPNLYRNKETCAFHKWDLSDLEEKIDFLLERPEKRVELAENAQNAYKHYLSEAGVAEFSERLIGIIGSSRP